MKWITRERPKIDRIACPWLISRFIDKEPDFLYVPPADVQRIAEETGAIPYDIPGVELSHVDELCSFDAFLSKYAIADPALRQLAAIVRGADTSKLDLAPQSFGLYAISLGLSHCFTNDHEMLNHGMVVYDALYAWRQFCQAEPHRWLPKWNEHGQIGSYPTTDIRDHALGTSPSSTTAQSHKVQPMGLFLVHKKDPNYDHRQNLPYDHRQNLPPQEQGNPACPLRGS